MAPLLSDSYSYSVNGVEHFATANLSQDGLSINEGSGPHSYRLKYIHLADVIGAKVHYGVSGNTMVYILIHYCPLVKNRFNGKTQRGKKLCILGAYQHDIEAGNLKQCLHWKNTINSMLNSKRGHGEEQSKKKYLIFVNPKGGKGFAQKIWLSSVQPLFDIANLKYDLVYTEYSGHAGDYMKDLEDLEQYDGITTVSGDGLVFEVVNGLMKRKDYKAAIKTPLVIIPAGSGNGLCAAILHQSGVPLTLMDAIFVAIRGRSTPMDLVKVEQEGRDVLWSFLSIAWGVMSCIDIESEKMRWMGETRFTVEALKKMINIPIKTGKVWFKLHENQTSEIVTPKSRKRSFSQKKCVTKQSVPSNDRVSLDGSVESMKLDPSFDFTGLNEVEDDSDPDEQHDGDNGKCDRNRTVSTMPHNKGPQCQCTKCVVPGSSLNNDNTDFENVGLREEIPDSWTFIDGEFSTVLAFYISHLSFGYQCSLSMRLDCGYMWLMYSEEGNRQDFLQLLLENVTPECNDTRTIHYNKVRAFRLEPEETESGAYVTVDGELVPYKPLHACIHQGLARVMCLQ